MIKITNPPTKMKSSQQSPQPQNSDADAQIASLTAALNDAIQRGSYGEASALKEQLKELRCAFSADMSSLVELDHR